MATETIGQIQTTYQGKTYTGPAAVAAEVLAQGGTKAQAYAAAALVNGVETSPSDSIDILSGGVGPAQGLFQFEPETWIGNGGGEYGATAGDATWQEQVTVFLNATSGGNYSDWGPDFGGSYSGNVTGPKAGSPVANALAQLTAGGTVAGLLGNVPSNWADIGGATPSNPVPGPVGDVLGLATGGTVPGDIATAFDNATSWLDFFKNDWEKILTIVGGVLLIAAGLFIMMRHQAAGAAQALA